MKKTKITAQQEKELLKKAKSAQGNKKKKDTRQIINSNLNLVKYMITRYFSYAKLDYEELLSEGIRSLPKAIEKFNLESSNRFAVYAGCWISQYIRSYIEKSKIIKSSSKAENTRDIIFYDDYTYQNDEKNSRVLDNISSGSFETNKENNRQYDIKKNTNNLINCLEEREMILFIRLYHQIVPNNCLDIYLISEEKEKNIFLNELKINKKLLETEKKKEDFLSSLPCELKKKKSTIIQKYLEFFETKVYKFEDIAIIIGKSENYLRKIKQICLSKLQELAKKNNIKI